MNDEDHSYDHTEGLPSNSKAGKSESAKFGPRPQDEVEATQSQGTKAHTFSKIIDEAVRPDHAIQADVHRLWTDEIESKGGVTTALIGDRVPEAWEGDQPKEAYMGRADPFSRLGVRHGIKGSEHILAFDQGDRNRRMNGRLMVSALEYAGAVKVQSIRADGGRRVMFELPTAESTSPNLVGPSFEASTRIWQLSRLLPAYEAAEIELQKRDKDSNIYPMVADNKKRQIDFGAQIRTKDPALVQQLRAAQFPSRNVGDRVEFTATPENRNDMLNAIVPGIVGDNVSASRSGVDLSNFVSEPDRTAGKRKRSGSTDDEQNPGKPGPPMRR